MTEYRNLKSKKEAYAVEKELKEKGFKRVFNSADSQIWEKGKFTQHQRIILAIKDLC